MGGGFEGHFGGTIGSRTYIKGIIGALPKNPNSLLKKGWKNITPESMSKSTSSVVYKESKTGLTVRFDKGTRDANGYSGKDHYHVHNPNSTGKHDYYLDKNGNPVPKNSKASHIIP